MRSLRIWLEFNMLAIQDRSANRFSFIFFLIGKVARIVLFLIFLNFLFSGTRMLGGYTREQIIFFYLTFNLVDILSQIFFREVYIFRRLVISGEFDFILLKPYNPLLKVLVGGVDGIDLILFLGVLPLTIWYGVNFISADPYRIMIYTLLLLNSLVIAAGFHIIVLALGVITESIDQLIWIYRDLSLMARIPVDLYIDPIRAILTFLIPLGIMMTLPAKVFMGIFEWQSLFFYILFSLGFLYLSLVFWKFALRSYSSAA